MANVQIPNLPAAISLNGTEQLEAVQAGATCRITTAQIAAFVTGSPTPFPVSIGGTGEDTFTAGYLKADGTNPFTTVASIPNTDITGLGTMSTQNSNAVSITGGSITGVTITTSTPLGIPSGGTGQSTATAAANALDGYLAIVSAAGTTTLTNTSSRNIVVTGTLAQTIQLPDVTTLTLGWSYIVSNISTGVLTIQSSGANSFPNNISGNMIVRLVCVAVTGTTTSSWTMSYIGSVNRTGTGSLVYSSAPSISTPTIAVINGGSAVSSTITLQSTTGAGTTDAIIFNTGSQVEKMRISSGGVTTITGTGIINANSASDALRITQTGAGNAFVVEDSTNPDASPFVIDFDGRALVNATVSVTGFSGLASPLQVNNGSGIGFAINRFSADAEAPSAQFLKSKSATYGTQAIVSADDGLGTIRFAGSDGTNFIVGSSITSLVDGTPGTNDMPGRLVFSTTADGASSPTERMRIDNAGIVSITGSLTLTTDLTVPNGGTGVSTFTTDGVLYGAGAGAILATAQGGANTILTANAGAPSFSATPTIGTSVTVPNVFGGTAVGSILNINSTSGVGTTDAITLDTGNQVERVRVDSSGIITYFQPAQTSLAAAATLDAAQVRTRIIQYTGAAATVTLPTGTTLDTVITSGMTVNSAFELTFINTSANLLTIGANGNTTVGLLTVAANTSGTFRFRKTAANTFTVYRVA
jgi:hypothetical protein